MLANGCTRQSLTALVLIMQPTFLMQLSLQVYIEKQQNKPLDVTQEDISCMIHHNSCTNTHTHTRVHILYQQSYTCFNIVSAIYFVVNSFVHLQALLWLIRYCIYACPNKRFYMHVIWMELMQYIFWWVARQLKELKLLNRYECGTSV